MIDGPGELYLVACEPLTSHGFALPLFGQRSRANTLYVARCDPPGDHTGRISGFEVYEPSHHIWLPDPLQLPAVVGGPWLDVFLRGDPIAAGNPAEVWAALKLILNDVAAEAPLSVLDAAIHAGAPERNHLAAEARAYVEAKFGGARATRWSTALVGRTLEIGVLHAAAMLPLTDDLHIALRTLRVNIDPGQGTVVLELSASSAPTVNEPLDRLLADLGSLAGGLQVGLRRQTREDRGLAAGTAMVPEPEDFVSASDKLSPPSAGILILAVGDRARAIARHLDLPGWQPEGLTPVEKDGELRVDGRTRRTGAPRPIDVITATRMDRLPRLAGPCSVLVALIDDAEREDVLSAKRLQAAISAAADTETVVLLAPALPEDLPTSAVLDAGSGRLASFDALLDTSQARSPFWWGSARRSIDRRVADIVMAGALLSLVPEVRSALVDRRLDPPVVLAFALTPAGALAPREEVMLASESTWVRRSPDRMLFSKQIGLEGRGATTGARIALIEGRAPKVEFEEFAREALGEVVRSIGAGYRLMPGAAQANSRLWPAEPPAESLGLHSPQHAVALTLARDPKDLRLVITAEAPELRSVAAARSAGDVMVRYTDTETLASLLTSPAEATVLPSEVRLPVLRSSPANRRLAARGVDQRDVVRVTEDQLQEWLVGVPDALRIIVTEELRTIRPTGSTQASSPTYAFRRKALHDFEAQDSGGLGRLRDILGLASSELSAPYKRQADLEISWSPSPPGRIRFAILDGELPPVVIRLEPGQAVLQTAFIVDADEGASALFRSRAFAVWARATLSRSSSWMSRFSVGSTFGGFPLPRGFKLVEEADRVVLDSSGAGDEVTDLAAAVETVVERELARTSESSWKLAHRVGGSSPMRNIDRRILQLYDLPLDADDLALLMRLSELNAKL